MDDRLIHGQVTVGWRQHLQYSEIWVVDDHVCADPYLRDALCLAAPPGVQVCVYRVDEAASQWASVVRHPSTAVLLLLRSPQVALALIEEGVALDRLNVGNLAAQPGSVRAFKSISLTRAQVDALDDLAGRGVCITFQLTPEDAQADWQVVRRRV